jgi:anti-sigma factor RsiW
MGWCMSRKTIAQYLDGELTPRGAARVEAHVAECPQCAEMVATLRGLDAALRHDADIDPSKVATPDIASRVTDELQRRGAFLKARVAAGQRRLFGGNTFAMRATGVAAVAATVLVTVGLVGSHLSRERWAGRAVPVLEDTERVLVTLVALNPSQRTVVARQESEQLRSLAVRLAQVREGAAPAWAVDLAMIERTLMLLADDRPLPPELVAQLDGRELLDRTVRLKQSLRGG